MALGRVKVRQFQRAQPLLNSSGADHHITLEDDGEGVRQAFTAGSYVHVCKAVGMELGTFGVWTAYRGIGEENAGEAAALVADLGFGTFWLGGSPRLSAVRPLLEADASLSVATGIVNVWTYEPEDLAREYSELSPQFGDRLLVGIGIGHPEATSDYTRPLASTRAFLEGIDAAPGGWDPIPPDRRALAALGPKMLDLCRERSRGTLTYFVGPNHTRAARERLGDGPLIATELACVLDTDPESARAAGRRYAEMYLGLSNYTGNLLRHGFSEDDIANGGSDRLIDTIVPHGTAEDIAAAAREHLDAGADHVCLQPVGVRGVPRAQWTALASALGLG
ncbi:MAG: LLM class F420-dependent oxidoreductase [Solirubrobacteraceae bacterium]